MSKIMSKIKPVGKPKVILKENFAENYKTYDLSFASTETKFKNPITKTQNNIVIFGFFHKKNDIIILAFFEII